MHAPRFASALKDAHTIHPTANSSGVSKDSIKKCEHILSPILSGKRGINVVTFRGFYFYVTLFPTKIAVFIFAVKKMYSKRRNRLYKTVELEGTHTDATFWALFHTQELPLTKPLN